MKDAAFGNDQHRHRNYALSAETVVHFGIARDYYCSPNSALLVEEAVEAVASQSVIVFASTTTVEIGCQLVEPFAEADSKLPEV